SDCQKSVRGRESVDFVSSSATGRAFGPQRRRRRRAGERARRATPRRRSQVVRQRSAKPSSRVRFPPSPQFPNESQVLSRVGQRSIKPLPRDQFVFWRFQSPLTRAGQKSSPERPRSAGQKSLGHGGLA